MKEFILSSPSDAADLHIDYEAELNEQQLPVVQQGDGRTLVLAGAGSGKTRTITYRVAWLLEHGVAPGQILLLTFTNKAAHEMVMRLEQLLGKKAQGLWAGTFHSIANRLLRKYAERIGYDEQFSILDQEDARELIKLCIRELNIDTKDKRFPSARVLQGILSYQRNKQESLQAILEERYTKFLGLRHEIEDIARCYERQKKTQNVMDFDDLLLRLRELLLTEPEVAKQLSETFAYILVDEFQDTNKVQSELVDLLSREHQNLLVVGDDAQSIYSFRAAEIDNILAFPKRYAGARVFRLTKNYRSTPPILDVANQVIAHNPDQFEKDLEAVETEGDLPLLVPAANANQEAQYIAEQVLQLHNQGTPLHEIAVLFRAAFHSQALEFELMKRDIPYEYRGGLKFFERAHIKDTVAHLRLLHNVRDLTAWMRALRLHPGIGAVTAQKIADACMQYADAQTALGASIKIGKRAAKGWQGFSRTMADLFETDGSPAALIRAFAGSDDYRDYLENQYPNANERLEDLEQFALFAEQSDDLGRFLEYVSLTQEYGAERQEGAPVDEDRMILSTIHQAKGLEWDAVFVMHLNEGSFPHGRAFKEEGGIAEERRLFYVATTRARKHLFLTYPLTAGFDTLEVKQPSSFLQEIRPDCIEQVRLRQANRNRAFAMKPKQHVSYSEDEGYEEPSIDVEDTQTRIASSSFLRDINDL